ncbi:MAG: hypothetical protein KC418_17550 [Anaerolineales bacterium]|nr:hypothetical protein [Anaerolineales bacterium]MCB8953294.1 hypothetical protein [Ardenticatenales bacterium]
MSDESQQCQGITRAGTQCKNNARPHSSYCHIHQTLDAAADPKPATPEQEAFRQLVQELNQVAAEVQALVEGYTPPPFTPQGMLALLKENLHRFTPEARLQIVRELQQSFEGASPRDLLDLDTWKGMWFLLNYSVQNQTEPLRESVRQQLMRLPGAATFADLQQMFEGATPKDLLDIDTWKGMWFLVNYSLQNQAQQVKRRLLGQEEEDND